jgi:hypothetical protein
MAMVPSSPLLGKCQRKVLVKSRNPTPELPLLEAAASELAAVEEFDFLPAAAFDVECNFVSESTPATTLPATPYEDESCSSCESEQEGLVDDCMLSSLLPVYEFRGKNTFLDLDSDIESGQRSRAVSDFTGLAELKAKGVMQVSVGDLRLPALQQIKATAYYEEFYEEAYPQPDEYVPMWCRIQHLGANVLVVPCAEGWTEEPPDLNEDGAQLARLWCWVQETSAGRYVVPCTDKDANNIYQPEVAIPPASFVMATSLPEDWQPELPEGSYVPEWTPGPYWPFNVVPTTLLLSNLPDALTQEDLLEVLDREEFSGLYDFVFLPEISSKPSERHALVNVTQYEHGIAIAARLHGKSAWGIGDEMRECNVTWSLAAQGLADLVHVYRDAPENQADISDELRPMLFSKGFPVPFPPANFHVGGVTSDNESA